MIRAILMTLAMLVGCAPSGQSADAPAAAAVPAPTPDDVRVRIGAQQAGQTVDVHVGERFAVELIGTPTAGYQWAVATLPAFLTRAGEATGQTSSAQAQPGYAGGNHWEVFLFAATGPGSGELVLEQRRPWEANEPASGIFRVTITAH